MFCIISVDIDICTHVWLLFVSHLFQEFKAWTGLEHHLQNAHSYKGYIGDKIILAKQTLFLTDTY